MKRSIILLFWLCVSSLCLAVGKGGYATAAVPMRSAVDSLLTDSIYIDASSPNLHWLPDTLVQATMVDDATVPQSLSVKATAASENTSYNYYDPYAKMPQSPTAAALTKFGTYHVNYGYGLPEIKIPLYDMVVDDIVVPIYLEYHASGIKVNETFSPVGAGWSLHAEPSVSRSVMDLPDERGCLSSGITSYTGEDETRNWIYKRIKDKMPDKFNYQLCDRSGGFNFDGTPNGNVILHPSEPLKVEYNYALTSISSFTIRDENGLVYTFGGADSQCTTGLTDPKTVSEWKCDGINSTVTGRGVSFEYYEYADFACTEDAFVSVEYFDNASYTYSDSSDPFLHALSGRFAVKLFDGSTNNIAPSRAVNFYSRTTGEEATNLNVNLNSIIQEQLPTHPSGVDMNNLLVGSITSDDGNYKVLFEYASFEDDYTKYLHTITVKDGNQTLRKITFHISKMSLANAQSGQRELCKLDSIRFENGGGLYQFDYYDPSSFPSRLSRARDFWGYYNGEDDNMTLVPSQLIENTGIIPSAPNSSIRVGDANREPNLDYMKKGSLRRIIYPTGGYTELEYDTHQYRYTFHQGNTSWEQDYKGGGLRIKSITDCAPNEAVPVRRSFSYSLGKCKYPPIRYHNDSTGRFTRYATRACDYYYYKKVTGDQYGFIHTNVVYCPATALSDWPVRYGAVVVYDSVSETRGDGSKSTYYYTYDNDFDSTEPDIYEYADQWDSWEFGQPSCRKDYARTASGYRLVRRTDYTYKDYNVRSTTGYRFVDNVRYYGGVDSGLSLSAPYIYTNPLTTGSRKLAVTRDSLYDASGHATVTLTENKYTWGNTLYDDLAFLRQSVTTNGDGTTVTESTRYPTDVSLSGTQENARQQLISQWLVGVPMERSVSRNGYPVAVAAFDYTNATVPRLSALRFGKTSASRERIAYSNYTNYGKPMYKVVDGVAKTVFLYSYLGEYPVAIISNASYADVCNAMGGESIVTSLCAKAAPTTSDWTLLEGLKNSLSGALVTVYRHKAHIGISRVAAPGTLPVTFDYDQMGRMTDSWLVNGSQNQLLEHNLYNYMNR